MEARVMMDKKRGLTCSSTQPEEIPKKKHKPNSSGLPRSVVYIPTDFLLCEIFTRLPAKTLCRFKAVCRSWCSAITSDPIFARDQSRHKSITSSGVVYCEDHRSLVFLPTLGAPVGVPDACLGFKNPHCFELLASTNGLLLLRICYGNVPFFYVCNPATGEGQFVPMLAHDHESSVGLLFDPSASPDHYKLVIMRRRQSNQPNFLVAYAFVVFSSSAYRWTASSAEEVGVASFWRPQKVVCADGTLYWYCTEYILSYDACKDAARAMKLPPTRSSDDVEQIGVWENRLTCTRATMEALQVWVMKKNEDEWEMWRCIYMQEVIEKNMDLFRTFSHPMLLRKKTLWERLRVSHWVMPVAYEGGKNVHLRMQVQERRGKKTTKEVILECHLETKDVVVLAENEVERRQWMQPFFSYRNSLVALPPNPFSYGASANQNIEALFHCLL